ncbi:hypothetical protein FN846DRAFT_178229 [Sphaerosporella brunnea]|uniref:Apple domain-containing protein n=1 Tax=Sphaerosporella brunnea TaxID=1250544 RepID=A0A5J5EQB6_9PEZI|nr:hypothetical protein FN846DRAFT_178229 [Sphaerosporella brunnea]
MVSTKSALAAGLFLLLSSVPAVTPADMDSNTGPIIKAIYNDKTGETDFWRAPAAAEKRGYDYYSYDLVDLLRSKKQWDFCKAYINLHPVVTRIVTTTACGIRNPKCLPTTVTKVVGVTQDVTNTITAQTPTVTSNSVATATNTVTDTVTVTSTVARPTVTKRSYIRPPSFLRGYPDSKISAACSTLVQNVIRTTTVTRTRTIPGKVNTATQTLTKTVATNTIPTTVTPDAVTVTNVISTTTVVVTDSVTSTTTVCPSATGGITGIAVSPPGSLVFPNAPRAADCCAACFNTPGCVGWWSVAGSICAFGVGSPPNAPPVSPQCPSGLGNVSFFTGGDPNNDLGGPGECLNQVQ